jgi:hypothetical protein
MSFLIERDPYKFLAGLAGAFQNRVNANRSILPQSQYFFASRTAVSTRFSALDRLAAEFPKACVDVNQDLGKHQEQHQLLFDFFSNAWASVESFCCGSYFIGSVLDPGNFPFAIPQSDRLTKLKKITPKATLGSYNTFEPNAVFTRQLQAFLDSNEYKLISDMRMLLEHRLVPGRTISISLNPGKDHTHLIDWTRGMTVTYAVFTEAHFLRKDACLNSMATACSDKGIGSMFRSISYQRNFASWLLPKD